jgi:hypothetical protein
MMMPSSLPNFEIPTGLMGTGLRGLRGFGRGLGATGSINLQPLAQAFLSGAIRPQFNGSNTWNPGYASTPQSLPSYYYLDDTSSAQIAALLGASVTKLPPFDVPPGTNIPLANWILFGDGTVVLAGNIAQEGILSPSIPNMSSLCGMQQLLSYAIPNGALDSSCTPNLQVGSTVQASAPQTAASLQSGYGLAPLEPYTGPVTTAPIQPVGTTPPQAVTIQPANPTGASATFTAADSCSTVASKIAALQAAGQSNITIWTQVPDALLTCTSVMALNPTDAMYQTGAGASQPGDVSSGGAGSGGTGTGNNTTTPPAADNTSTYLAIGAAVLIGLWAISGGNR